MLGTAVAWWQGNVADMAAIGGPVSLLILLSLADDLRPLPAKVRLACHLLAALWLLSSLGGTGRPLVNLMLIVGCAWAANLYNFMDGADGLAGGMAAIGFGGLGFSAYLHGDANLALACLAIAAAAAGFLLFNLAPAKIFMGDAGSVPLGFLAAAIGYLGWRHGAWPGWLPLCIFSPFVIDASLTLFARARRGERLSEAHREHFYQRLVRMGWSHRRLAAHEYLLMVSVTAWAIALTRLSPAWQWLGLGMLAAGYSVIVLSINSRWNHRAQV